MKKITAIWLTVLLMFSMTAGVSASDGSLVSSITATYKEALSLAKRSSFYGNCNLATAYQLQAMGIYEGGLDYSGAGNLWYDYFSGVSETSGGYSVVTVSGKNCLYDLIEKYGNEIYNVVYSLGTGGTSGTKHVLFIRAILDGNVYFADSFGCTYGSSYYPEGTGTVLALDRFVSAYKAMNGDAYGCVYFTGGTSQHFAGSATAAATVYTPDDYRITASSLRIRSKASTAGDVLGLIPNGETVEVAVISGAWGRVEYKGITGWICLDYAERIRETEEEFSAVSLTADTALAFEGDTVSWTAQAQGGSGIYFYCFTVYKDGEIVSSGAYSSGSTVSCVVDGSGVYQASVEVTDSYNNKASLAGDEVVCVREEADLLYGDVNGDGVIAPEDARLTLRFAASLESLTAQGLIRADIDGDGAVTSADARLILRKAASLE